MQNVESRDGDSSSLDYAARAYTGVSDLRKNEAMRTKATVLQETIADISERWFGQSEATLEEFGPYQRLVWRRPGSSSYYMRYTLIGGTLYVSGDCGDGVYNWYSYVTWKDLAGMELDYFTSKRAAGSKGRGAGYDWHAKVARNYLTQYIDEQEQWGYDASTIAQYREAASELDLSARDFLMDDIDDVIRVFGHDSLEWITTIGDVWDYESVALWLGVRMAYKQLQERDG